MKAPASTARRVAMACLGLGLSAVVGIDARLAAAEGDELQISARLLKEEVLLGDDVVVEITIENRTAAAIDIPELRLASDSVSVAVKGAGVRDARVTRLYGAFSSEAGSLQFKTTPTRRISVPADGSHVGRVRIAAVAAGRLEFVPSVAVGAADGDDGDDGADAAQVLTAPTLSVIVNTTNTVRRLAVRVETSRQPFTIELDGSQAFNSVAHFWRLAREGFYTNLPFHRVVPNLLVQTGDARGDGAGGPGFFLPAEPSQAPFRRGTVGLARGEHSDSAGAQWFVVSTPPGVEVSQAAFVGGFTALGRVVEGMEAVDVLAQVTLRPESHEPLTPDRVRLTTASVK